MTILLTRATRIGGSIIAAGTQQTLAEAIEADFVYRGIATWVGGAPVQSGAGVPVMASTNVTGGVVNIVLSNTAAVDADGRPDGTIYVQTV